MSSLLATLHDGLFYQATLSTWALGYGAAALVGAVAGGLTNFLLNRYWTFRSTDRSLLRQTILYVAGSVLTFLVLRAALWILVEKAGVRERVAWFPAKAMAWVVMAYPFQRWVVFSRAKR